MVFTNRVIWVMSLYKSYAVVIVLLVLLLMWIWNKPNKHRIRVVYALILFLVAALYNAQCGSNKGYEGRAPLFMVLMFAGAASLGPFCIRLRRWQLPLYVFLMIIAGAATSIYLTDSYERPDITGNPAFSSGRFWHTPFTGQYPRDMEKTQRFIRDG